MKRAVLFFNGDTPQQNLVFKSVKTTDTIICADGGARHVIDAGLIPHVIIGDLDSLPQVLQKKLRKLPIEWVTFPTDKNFTDSELTLQYVRKNGFSEIVILGFFGDRSDHVQANIMLLATIVQKNPKCKISVVDENQTLYFVSNGSLMLEGKKGQTVSLLPLLTDAKGVVTTGLRWKLRDEILVCGATRGVSNEFSGKKVSISLAHGVLLVVAQG